MLFYRKKINKGHWFLSFGGNLSNKYKNLLLDTGLDSLKTTFKKVFYKTSEFIENKIADALVKLNDDMKMKRIIEMK